MKPSPHLHLPAVVLLLSIGCAFTFTPDAFQSLRLHFQLSSDLPEGTPTVVQTLVFPEQLKLKKRFLSVAGEIDPSSRAFPERIELVAESADVESGKTLSTIKLTLQIGGDGSFQATRKLKKNLAAGSMTTVTLESIGGDLDAGTPVTLCVDLVKKKSDLDGSMCGEGDEPPAPTTFSAIQAEILTPTCARGGCHDTAAASAGLVLTAGRSYGRLVGVPSNQVPFRFRVDPGNADGSYLMMKLLGSSGISGVRMPLGGPFLSDAQIAGIEEWIDAGAADN